jgi:HrpA-like RNA helicase
LNDFIEPPDSAYINTSIDQLTKLNIIDDTKLTELGHTILNMQMDPMASLTVLASYQLNCMREVIGIISMIEACKGSMTELFNLPIDIVGDDDSQQLKYLNKKFDTAKSVFNNRYGDHLSLLKMFKTYLTKVDDEKKVKEWIYKYFLKRSTFEKARNNYKRYSGVHYRIRNNIQKKDIANLMDYDISYRILASFMFGYRLNLGTASKKGISTDHIKSVNINRYSFVNHDVKQKKLVLYYELFTTSKDTNMNIVSSISKKVMELFEQIKI